MFINDPHSFDKSLKFKIKCGRVVMSLSDPFCASCSKESRKINGNTSTTIKI